MKRQLDERNDWYSTTLKDLHQRIVTKTICETIWKSFFSLEKVRLGTPDTISFRVDCRPPVKSDVILCHGINVSQSDFTANDLHVAIQGRRRKQNRTLAIGSKSTHE